MKENKNIDLITTILDYLSKIILGITLFLFILQVQFKVYFLCFILGSFLLFTGIGLKLVFNKENDKRRTILGIVCIVIMTIILVYDFINTIQL